ncbi:MAG: Holliday junction branch migration protein RuvA [Candidatus Muiribacteriota bacterium]
MYKYIIGTVTEKKLNTAVCEANGIGYILNMPLTCLQKININDNKKFFVYQAVRDTEIELYGFSNEENLTLFKKLISISKIGPKIALNILSLYSTPDFTRIVHSGDVEALAKVSGIGKKGAGRIILEMKGKINFDDFDDDSTTENYQGIVGDTAEALRNFGYSPEQIKKVIKSVEKNFDENSPLEEVIRFALKKIN